jgi:hypothetical protein
LFILPLAWFLGGLLGSTIESLPTLPDTAVSFLILGVLVAADLDGVFDAPRHNIAHGRK